MSPPPGWRLPPPSRAPRLTLPSPVNYGPRLRVCSSVHAVHKLSRLTACSTPRARILLKNTSGPEVRRKVEWVLESKGKSLREEFLRNSPLAATTEGSMGYTVGCLGLTEITFRRLVFMRNPLQTLANPWQSLTRWSVPRAHPHACLQRRTKGSYCLPRVVHIGRIFLKPHPPA